MIDLIISPRTRTLITYEKRSVNLKVRRTVNLSQFTVRIKILMFGDGTPSPDPGHGR